MAESLQPASQPTDPRILRSRQMLMDSLARLLEKKEFEEISVQEIAGEAMLNRATFYLHYPDKNALLQAMAEARFRELIERRGIAFTDCGKALHSIALGVCDYLTEVRKCPAQESSLPLEGSVIPVVEAMFTEGLSRHRLSSQVDSGLLATAAAWAIFGIASRWLRTRERVPAEKIAAKIETVVKPMLLGSSNPKQAVGRVVNNRPKARVQGLRPPEE